MGGQTQVGYGGRNDPKNTHKKNGTFFCKKIFGNILI